MISQREIYLQIFKEGKSHPQLELRHIEEQVLAEQYYVFPHTTMTVCCITTKNGHHVIGTGSCVGKENFTEYVGRKIARQKAIAQLWELEAYLFRHKLASGELTLPPDDVINPPELDPDQDIC